jgi:hypothetical protein
VQHRELAAGALRGHEPQRRALAADLDQLVATIEHLRGAVHVEREELGHRQRHAVEHLLQRTHRGLTRGSALSGNEAVGDARAARQLALRQAMQLAHVFEARPDVDTHGG